MLKAYLNVGQADDAPNNRDIPGGEELPGHLNQLKKNWTSYILITSEVLGIDRVI
jgi:hypothetical protein